MRLDKLVLYYLRHIFCKYLQGQNGNKNLTKVTILYKFYNYCCCCYWIIRYIFLSLPVGIWLKPLSKSVEHQNMDSSSKCSATVPYTAIKIDKCVLDNMWARGQSPALVLAVVKEWGSGWNDGWTGGAPGVPNAEVPQKALVCPMDKTVLNLTAILLFSHAQFYRILKLC